MLEHHHLLHALNDAQRTAVAAPLQNLLVLAGAGSGKTRVLTHRIAWLIETQQISPYSILAVTFTNKAAYEMRNRIESLLGLDLNTMWVGTFHGLAHRLLRMHSSEAQLPNSFQILDSDDQQRLIRRVIKALNLDDAKWPPKQAQGFINKQKEEGLRPHHLKDYGDFYAETMLKIYKAYEEVCQRSGLVDFSELLLRSLELLQQHPAILAHYQQRLRHILVDEFQDTNTIQYQWLKTLAGTSGLIIAVGDDDQSIYSWRGAKVENLHRFTKDFPQALTIRLEQNYRSTQTILNAANAVIENNEGRLGKKLWTQSNVGDPIILYNAFNEYDEAGFIISTIKEWVRQEGNYNDIAILYRSNAQSRLFEEQLIENTIPYRIYGGLKFFERAEIKDALAYLRLIANRDDDAAFERVVNLPTRGIGNTTLNEVRDESRKNGSSLWQCSEHMISGQLLSARAGNSLNQFLKLVHLLDQETKSLSLGEQCAYVLKLSGLMDHYEKDHSEQGRSKVENLQELINATCQFNIPPQSPETSALNAFLAHVALETGESQSENGNASVSLMTLHAAKGLEFPVVFIAGMEENLFPHVMTMNDPRGLEEERRLCYVGITRAMKKLHISYAECRRLYGKENYHFPSRFIKEIPSSLIKTVRAESKVMQSYLSQNAYSSSSHEKSLPSQRANKWSTPTMTDIPFKIGQRVHHSKFGTGHILGYEGQGEHLRVQVKFEREGIKWLVASFAKLEIV